MSAKQLPKFLIYGAYGYTGQLISRLAYQQGWKPILAGRNRHALEVLANDLNAEYFVVGLNDKANLMDLLHQVPLVLNCAGPYEDTALPMAQACLQTNTHYLDITGEIMVFEALAAMHQQAHDAGVLLLPGVGFDVVPSDCLAAWLHEQLPNGQDLELAFYGAQNMSRGTALTMLRQLPKGGLIRQSGQLKKVPLGWKCRLIPFSKKVKLGVTVPWGDVATAWYSTGIPNITVYMATSKGLLRAMRIGNRLGKVLGARTVQAFLSGFIKRRMDGPGPDERLRQRSYLWGQLSNAQGQSIQATLEVPEAYHLTMLAAFEAVKRVLLQVPNPRGFSTPSKLLGTDFIMHFANTRRRIINSPAPQPTAV